MSKTYVIGHQKPDTDAVVAAMATAYLFNHKESFGRSNAEAVIVDPLNPETTYLFDRFNVDSPRQISAADITSDDAVVLVDHNESSQRLLNLSPDQIVEIIDHHKVNLDLSTPIFLTFKPWGSSSTIIYYLMKQHNLTPDKQMAQLLLAAILSDTVGFKSSTTTDQDRAFGQELAKQADVENVDQFAFDILRAKSDVSTLTPAQIAQNDYKIYEFGKKVFISQLETVEPDKVLSQHKQELLAALEKIKQDQGVDFAFMAISDVLTVQTQLLLVSEAETNLAEKAFGGTSQNNLLDIGPRLSRKKEIAPAIEQSLA